LLFCRNKIVKNKQLAQTKQTKPKQLAQLAQTNKQKQKCGVITNFKGIKTFYKEYYKLAL